MDYRGTVRNEIQNVLHELDSVNSLVAKRAETELDDVEIRQRHDSCHGRVRVWTEGPVKYSRTMALQ